MRRLEDNIRMDLKEIGINTKNLVDSAQDRDYWRTLLNAALTNARRSMHSHQDHFIITLIISE